MSVRFLVKTSSAVNDTSALPVPFEILNLSAVSPSAMPIGFVPLANAISLSMVLVEALVCARFTCCPVAVIK